MFQAILKVMTTNSKLKTHRKVAEGGLAGLTTTWFVRMSCVCALGLQVGENYACHT